MRREWKEWKGWVFLLLQAILIFCAWLTIERKRATRNEPEIQCDTIYRVDTLKVTDPVEVIKERRVDIHDTIMVSVTDTIVRNDTIYVNLPREIRRYSGESYKAEVSGYDPRLDWIDVYPEREIITKVERIKPSRWSLGIQGGIGLGMDLKVTPYIGIGISYNIWNFGK